MLFLEKKKQTNLNKYETESKIENSTHIEGQEACTSAHISIGN